MHFQTYVSAQWCKTCLFLSIHLSKLYPASQECPLHANQVLGSLSRRHNHNTYEFKHKLKPARREARSPYAAKTSTAIDLPPLVHHHSSHRRRHQREPLHTCPRIQQTLAPTSDLCCSKTPPQTLASCDAYRTKHAHHTTPGTTADLVHHYPAPFRCAASQPRAAGD